MCWENVTYIEDWKALMEIESRINSIMIKTNSYPEVSLLQLIEHTRSKKIHNVTK